MKMNPAWAADVALELLGANAPPRQVRRLLERIQSKEFWHRAIATRTSAVARGIFVIERAVGDRYTRRERRGAQWIFYAKDESGNEVKVASLDVGHARTLEDLSKPTTIWVDREDLIDSQLLREACTPKAA